MGWGEGEGHEFFLLDFRDAETKQHVAMGRSVKTKPSTSSIGLGRIKLELAWKPSFVFTLIISEGSMQLIKQK